MNNAISRNRGVFGLAVIQDLNLRRLCSVSTQDFQGCPEFGRKRVEDLMGGFYGTGLEVEQITFIHIPLAKT